MAKSRDAFRTISEVAEWLDTQAHVLRFWESKFTQVKPVKRAGGRRYYRPVDMQLLGGIKKLLHDDGMTIKGAQKLLREKGIKHVTALSQPLDEALALDVVQDAPKGAVKDTAKEPSVPDTPVKEDATVIPLQRAKRDETAYTEPETSPTKDLDSAEPRIEEPDTDLFEKAAQNTAPETETAAPDPDLPPMDTMPAFLQRVTPASPPATTDVLPKIIQDQDTTAPASENIPLPETKPVAAQQPTPITSTPSSLPTSKTAGNMDILKDLSVMLGIKPADRIAVSEIVAQLEGVSDKLAQSSRS